MTPEDGSSDAVREACDEGPYSQPRERPPGAVVAVTRSSRSSANTRPGISSQPALSWRHHWRRVTTTGSLTGRPCEVVLEEPAPPVRVSFKGGERLGAESSVDGHSRATGGRRSWTPSPGGGREPPRLRGGSLAQGVLPLSDRRLALCLSQQVLLGDQAVAGQDAMSTAARAGGGSALRAAHTGLASALTAAENTAGSRSAVGTSARRAAPIRVAPSRRRR